MPIAQKSPIASFRDLHVWQKSIDLVELCYRLAAQLPANEEYGLASQIRRAAVSVPANIAEGHGRKRTGDYLHHLSIANGSLAEVQTHFLITIRLRLLAGDSVKSVMDLADEVGRMLSGLMDKLERKLPRR